jgi:hypothetical protein
MIRATFVTAAANAHQSLIVDSPSLRLDIAFYAWLRVPGILYYR